MIDTSVKKKYCAGIVTYNPDLQKLDTNIGRIIDQVEAVLICDNGSKNLEDIRGYIKEYSKIQLLTFPENKGIAAALNCLAKESLTQGYEWILTLDQDSVCPSNLISTFEQYVSDDVAILSPRILYKNNEQYSEIQNRNIEEVQWVITSASFTNLEVWKKLGGFDEKLFIDKVDYDFCIRAGNAGFKILRINDVTLMHELGDLKCRKVFGRTIYVTNHSASRRYYMIRNGFYLSDKLKEGHPWEYTLKNFVKIIVFEENKMEKLKKVKRGIVDGLKMHGGGVIVLLSTYNGERYLRVLIDSVLAQKDVEVYLLIRDDGSSDGTCEIIREYVENFDNVNASFGANVGVVESFNTLIQDPLVDEFDYIAFCDQDDYWMPTKLNCALSYMDNDNQPEMYCSNLRVVDENLNYLRMYRDEKIKFDCYTALVQNCATGCTQVFNKKAAQLYRKGIGCKMEMHDYWMFLVCLYMGRVYYDENSYILYRQHGNNVVGAKEKKTSAALKNLVEQKDSKRIGIIKNFADVYEQIDEERLRILYSVINYNNSMLSRIKLAISWRYRGYDLAVTIGFKIRCLVGKMY